MLNKKNENRCSLYAHYFWFYFIVVTYLLFESCGGVQTELIPKRNITLSYLSAESKEVYLTLNQILNDNEKEQLEKTIGTIKSLDALNSFIRKKLQNYIAYKDLLKLLSHPERIAFKQKFAKAIDLNEQERLIYQNANGLTLIQTASTHNRQSYIDLLEVLPENQAIALKNKMVKCTNLNEVDELIASQLPKSFTQLDDRAREQLSKLPDNQRRAILITAIKEQSSIKLDSNQATTPIAAHDGTFMLPSPEVDINQLIDQTAKKQQSKICDDIPQDNWGPKLSLKGKSRKQFLTSIMQFSQSDQKYLKELFNKVDADSIDNFLSVYETGFNKDERIELLATMIYLYKGWPEVTIKSCNDPSLLSWSEKWLLFKKTNSSQLELLTKLNNILEELRVSHSVMLCIYFTFTRFLNPLR